MGCSIGCRSSYIGAEGFAKAPDSIAQYDWVNVCAEASTESALGRSFQLVHPDDSLP